MQYDDRFARRAAAILSELDDAERRFRLRDIFERYVLKATRQGMTEMMAERLALDELHRRMPSNVTA